MGFNGEVTFLMDGASRKDFGQGMIGKQILIVIQTGLHENYFQHEPLLFWVGDQICHFFVFQVTAGFWQLLPR